MLARILLLIAVATAILGAQTKLLRYPDIHGDQLVFVYAGDLWTSSTDGGSAVRLTAHEGLELFPKFSPDGRSIAFTGQYDGDEQVYVIPAQGGVPKQLTYFPARGPLAPRWGYDHHVYGWTPDGSSVLFRSTRDYWGAKDGKLYTVPTTGRLPTALEMPVAGGGDLSPDGDAVAYSPLFRGLSSVETLSRRLGARPLHLLSKDGRNPTNHRPCPQRSRPHVDRRLSLFRFRPRRHSQPISLRNQVEENFAANAAKTMGRCAGHRQTATPKLSTSSTESSKYLT